jgi:hypothetical protein
MAASRPRTAATPAAVSENGHAQKYLTLEEMKVRAAGLPAEADLEIPALGGTVRVRRISLPEMRMLSERVQHETKGAGDSILGAFYTAHAGLVEPHMTEAEFEEIADILPMVVFEISAKVNELTEGSGESGAATLEAAAATFREMG